MNIKRKFSIIIPTRDRADTLFWCLKTIVCQTYDNLEILVSDNHSKDNTYDVVHSLKDDRIRYIKPIEKLSMSKHFEFAFANATGDYIGSIGDDDGLLPNCFEYLNSLIHKYGEFPISNQYSSFSWGNNYINPSEISINMRLSSRLYNSNEALNRLYNFQNFYSCAPIIYYGFIPRYLYKKAIENTKNSLLINSINPDMYTAILFLNLTDKFIYSLKPYCIAGVSSKSNGQSCLNGKTNSEKSESNKFLNESENLPIHEKVNLGLSSIPLLILESFLQVNKNLNSNLLKISNLKIDNFLFVALSEALCKNDFQKENEIIAIKSTCKLNNLSFEKLYNKIAKKRENKKNGILKKYFGHAIIVNKEIKNIYDACLFHEKYYNSHSHFKYNLGRKISEILKGSTNI